MPNPIHTYFLYSFLKSVGSFLFSDYLTIRKPHSQVSCRTTLCLSFNAEMFRVSHFRVNHYFLGIGYLCRKVTLSAEMHAKRIARHIIDHENQFPFHWLQCRLNILFQYRKNLILYDFFFRKAHLCLKVSR